MSYPECAVIVEEVTDPAELAAAQVQDERFERNVAWLREHAEEVYSQHRGQFICIAGRELFVADTPEEVLSLAGRGHPEDNGRYLRYIPREKVARIYASAVWAAWWTRSRSKLRSVSLMGKPAK